MYIMQSAVAHFVVCYYGDQSFTSWFKQLIYFMNLLYISNNITY